MGKAKRKTKKSAYDSYRAVCTWEEVPVICDAGWLARMFAVGQETIAKWRREDGLPFVSISSHVIRYNKNDVMEWAKARASAKQEKELYEETHKDENQSIYITLKTTHGHTYEG